MKKVLLLLLLGILLVACNQEKSHLKDNLSNQKLDDSSIVNKTLKKDIDNQQSQNKDLLNKIVLKSISLKCRGRDTRAASVYGSGVTMYFTITNNTDLGVEKVFFKGTFKFAGRNYSHSEEINYEFRKGLEPGESQKIAMRPGRLSKWNNKIKPGEKGKLSLKVISIEDYDGSIKK